MVSTINPNDDANYTLSSAEDRVKALTTVDDDEASPVAHKARIEPCTHGSYTYTINDDNQHTARCSYCGNETVENHATESTCPCGYDTGVTVYDVTLNTCVTDADIDAYREQREQIDKSMMDDDASGDSLENRFIEIQSAIETAKAKLKLE